MFLMSQSNYAVFLGGGGLKDKKILGGLTLDKMRQSIIKRQKFLKK